VPSDTADAARATLGGAVQAAKGLGTEEGARLVAAARAAYTQAFEVTALVCTGLALAAAIGTVVVLKEAGTEPKVVKAAA
jgi:MFS transporter, DHA2 family, multidrug resistance protein